MLKNILKNVQRPEIDFSALKKPRRPNSYLMSPAGYCPFPPNEISPVFDMAARDLEAKFETIVDAEPRTEKFRTIKISNETQIDFVQYSAFFGFPDTITIRFIELGPETSTLAIYSRAHYGRRDFGVNEKRIKDWMHKLKLSL